MTDLEKAVARSLRISSKSAEYLLPEIQRNIETARVELNRSGVPQSVIDESNSLVEDAIITYCLVRMGEASDRSWYEEVFRTQQDNIRKSYEE